MALSDDINNLPTTVGDGNTGHLANHQTIHAGLKDHEARIQANEKKITDTGWRDITSLLNPPPNSGTLRIRRVLNHVQIAANYLTYSSGVSATATLPKDWWAGTSASAPLNTTDGSRNGAIIGTYSGEITIAGSTGLASICAISLPSSQPIPADMIGTAL